MSNLPLRKLDITLALIAISIVLLSAFGVIELFVAVGTLIVVFLFGFVSRAGRTGDNHSSEGGANG